MGVRLAVTIALLCLMACAMEFSALAQTNVALAGQGAAVIADSVYDGDVAEKAIDGTWLGPGEFSGSNRWHGALEKPHPHWVWVRFRQAARISRVVIHRADIIGHPVDFAGEYSADGGFTFRELFKVTNNRMDESTFTVERSFDPVVTDNFRLRILRSSNTRDPNYAQVSEIEVFGDYVEQPRPEITLRAGKSPRARLKPTTSPGLAITRKEDEIEFRSNWLRVCLSRQFLRVTALCWDSLGKGKVDENLLKPGESGGARATLSLLFPASDKSDESHADIDIHGNVVRYGMLLPGGIPARWEVRVEEKGIRMLLSADLRNKMPVRTPPGVHLAFDVSKTPVAPLANPEPGASAPLPLILHASDYGSLLIKSSGDAQLIGEPLRSQAQWNASVIARQTPRQSDGLYVLAGGTYHLDLTASVEGILPVPGLTESDPRLASFPRHWLNTFQYRPDIGILSNNVVSDNAVFCMHTFTDPAVFTPTLPGGIEVINLARESLDRYFAGAKGYGIGWEDMETETYPSLLISAWDVVRVTGDMDFLRRWRPHLERMASEMHRQDRNGNGLPESTKPGVAGGVAFPGSNWWDQINFGHEDAYVCALAYRALQCLADLEQLAGKPGKADLYKRRAEKIREAYVPAFFNPETGIIAGWRDADGKLHDYWFTFVNGIAITQGLVPDDLANGIVDRIEAKMKEVGYDRFDLGLPGPLVPIRRNDYGAVGLGHPEKEDGTDAWQVFENGGATACFAGYYVQALYKLGRPEEAERILWPMMKTYADGGFQNGVGKGGEWRRWDGTPSGYEGMLADAYQTQMLLFTGHYGIGFEPEGFYLEPWSPLRGKRVPLGLKYMGKAVKEIR